MNENSEELDGLVEYVIDHGDTLSESMGSLEDARELACRYSPPLPVYRVVWEQVKDLQ